jgi:hypothetical protein
MLFSKNIREELTYTGYRKDGGISVDRRNPGRRTDAPDTSQSFR